MEKYAGVSIWAIAAKKVDLTPPPGSRVNPRQGQAQFEFIYDLFFGNRNLMRDWLISRQDGTDPKFQKSLYDFLQKMVKPEGANATLVLEAAADYMKKRAGSARVREFLQLFNKDLSIFIDSTSPQALNKSYEDWSEIFLPTPQVMIEAE